MVEPAVPEGVGPPVAAYDPDALLHERIGHEEKAPRFGRVRALERGLQREDPFALSGDIGLRVLRSRQERAGERLADARGAPVARGGASAPAVAGNAAGRARAPPPPAREASAFTSVRAWSWSESSAR